MTTLRGGKKNKKNNKTTFMESILFLHLLPKHQTLTPKVPSLFFFFSVGLKFLLIRMQCQLNNLSMCTPMFYESLSNFILLSNIHLISNSRI